MVDRLDKKFLTRNVLLARYGAPRRIRVVFTNGVFDLLHRGHVEYLHDARELGDALVVGINSDESTRRLKGAGRPVNSEIDRAIVLAALECVDAVTLFDEDTPRELIAALLPDILVKGGDYRPDEVVGRAEVEKAGGRVVILDYLQGRSTSSMLERLREETPR
jgi:rfaE bifunctional protein nucleotidyltransferase chain/domain